MFFPFYHAQAQINAIMSRHHNTVERLDRPSAYYQSKVLNFQHIYSILILTCPSQNKRRRYNDRDDDKHEDPNDDLRNATTLYVGNLYVHTDHDTWLMTKIKLICYLVLSTQPRNRSTSCSPSTYYNLMTRNNNRLT